MATLLIADPPAVRLLMPQAGAASFTLADLGSAIGPGGGPLVIVRVRSLLDARVHEVIVARATDTQAPLNPIAMQLLVDAGQATRVYGVAVHAVEVCTRADSGRGFASHVADDYVFV